jgi:hypothetical protein
LNHNDPTDHALAAIASILDRPAENLAPRVEDKIGADPESKSELPPPEVEAETGDIAPSPAAVPEPMTAPDIDLEHYEKLGPGPIDAIRFRWSARRDDFDNYYVDETIGPNSRPLSTGPMPKSEVIRFIDDRAQEAEQRYRTLKNEMTLTRGDQDGGES